MRAIGAGALLSGGAGTAAAQEDGDQDGEQTTDADAGGTVHEVQLLIRPSTNERRPADFFFQPTGLQVDPGDVIRFVFATPEHTVVSMHPAYGMRRRVPTGVDAFSSPLLGWKPESIPGDQVEPPGPSEGADGNGNGGSDDGPVPDTWLRSFDMPGVYDLLCSPHEGFGMAMRVVVGDETETEFETSNADALPEPRAGPVGLSRVTLTDPALEPSAIVEAGTVRWEELEANPGGQGTEEM
jgi:plastocyanin